MSRVINFSAGPATLPLEVLAQAKEELLDWHGLGMSVMEISHRGPDFMAFAEESEQELRDLLAIPSNYKVLFLQGGGRSQFAMVPMNLLRGKTSANYFDTGIWSRHAIQEAARYCTVNVVASSEASGDRGIPPREVWQIDPNAAYAHFVDNETINGVEFPSIPEVGDLPLVSDMSSNLLSRPFDMTRFALVYAGAQKNIGPAGLTLVIVREDLLGEALPFTPSMFNYALHAKQHSMLNTPPTFAWYMAGLTFKWLKSRGRVAAMADINQRKAETLYRVIDEDDFYINPIDKAARSRMDVVFALKDASLTERFLQEAASHGLVNLKGHKLVGDMRASIYNAMSLESVNQLVDFMKFFSKRMG